VKPVVFPEGYRLEVLRRGHPRSSFSCGEAAVDDWLRTKALQQQEKHLSVTKALIDPQGAIAGFYTLASAQIDFRELPSPIAKKLPRRLLPVAILAWLGVSADRQGQGFGERLVAQALLDCHAASSTFPFVGVILDCVNDQAKKFYGRWNFLELPGNPYRLIFPARQLEAICEEKQN
jgi:GNAT superfamily N-acetyltransferase